MAAPTIDGSAVFGGAVECHGPDVNPRREQTANYPGLNGTERLDMGDQGMVTTIEGRLAGSSPGDLASAIGNLLSFYDGAAHTLVDTDGTSWPNVVLVSFERQGRKQFDPVIGYTQRYAARFLHLTLG